MPNTDPSRRLLTDVSFGLMRTCGCAGFLLAGLGGFAILRRLLHVEVDMSSLAHIGGKAAVVLVLSILLGLIGLLIGQTVGCSMPIRRQTVASIIDSLWHFGANGSVTWLMLSSLLLSAGMGKERAQEAARTVWPAVVVVAVGIVVGWVVFVLLVWRMPVGLRTNEKRLFPIAPLLFTGAVGAIQAWLFDVNWSWGLPMALAPILFVQISVDLARKDSLRRKGLQQ